MSAPFSQTLINSAVNHLRRSPSEPRRQTLLAAGLPADDAAALARWIRAASDANAIDAGCVFHACTARVSNGVDADLPTIGKVGCRVSVVPVSARIDAEASDMRCRQVRWVITWGNCGTGFMEPVWIDAPKSADPAQVAADHRARMLQRGDCFATRAEAEAAAIRLLHERTAAR